MNPRRLAIGLAFLAAVIPATAGFPETPIGTSFPHDGYLADEEGVPANGVFDFRFILYDASAGGNQVGPINNRGDRTVTDGRFAVKLDFGAAFAGNKRWLETGWRPGDSASADPYTILSSRLEILPVPVALYSSTASSSSTAPWDGLSGMPAGFADGTDDDTTYAGGLGIVVDGNEISIAPDSVSSGMIKNGAVQVSDLNSNVDGRYVMRTDVRAGADASPRMCGGSAEAVYFNPAFTSGVPAVVISADGISNTPGVPNTSCAVDAVTSQGFVYCCWGTTPDNVRWIATDIN